LVDGHGSYIIITLLRVHVRAREPRANFLGWNQLARDVVVALLVTSSLCFALRGARHPAATVEHRTLAGAFRNGLLTPLVAFDVPRPVKQLLLGRIL